jgi:hypothetical protein
MHRPLDHLHSAHASASAAVRLAAANPEQLSQAPGRLPQRPDLAVLSEAIPLFYIGQNRRGLWVVREAEGRSGGIFVCRDSAVRFAKEESEPGGCATMFVTDPLELDIENGGSGLVALLAAATDAVSRHVPALAALAGAAFVKWRNFISPISRTLAGKRKHRAAIERELFHGHFWLASKSDDDLPIFH